MALLSMAGINIDLVLSGAPNIYGSSSYQPWFNNAQYALRNQLNDYGTGYSEYFNMSGQTRPVYEAAVAGFEAWNGVLAPGSGELGQRMHGVYRIYDTSGADVKLENIGGLNETAYFLDGTTSDLGGPYNFNSSTVFNGITRVGYLADGTKITSGNQAVKQIIGTFGLGFEPDVYTGNNSYDWYKLLGQLGDPNTGLSYMDTTISYKKGTATFSRTQFVNFVPAPEPASMAVLAVGTLALLRRRKKS